LRREGANGRDAPGATSRFDPVSDGKVLHVSAELSRRKVSQTQPQLYIEPLPPPWQEANHMVVEEGFRSAGRIEAYRRVSSRGGGAA
ncbi:MAG: hypothetical protein ABIU84_07530, partial [Thermoanaerobaculia bacterium]